MAVPERLVEMTTGELDRSLVPVARVLGVRHLLQALLLSAGGARWARRVGAAADTAHVVSMVGAALVVEGPARRAATVDSVVEAVVTGSSFAARP